MAEAGAQSNAAAAQQAVAALQSLKEGAASGGGGRSGATTGAVLDDYSFEDNWHDWDPYGCLKLN